MGKEFDIEDEIFESRLADKRHKELKGSLDKLLMALDKNPDTGVASAIEKQSVAIKDFTKAVSSLPSPQVNVDLNQQNVVSSIEKMCASILKSQSELKELVAEQIKESKRLKEWRFDFNKNYNGDITTSTAKQIK